jgi:hypothetical protein
MLLMLKPINNIPLNVSETNVRYNTTFILEISNLLFLQSHVVYVSCKCWHLLLCFLLIFLVVCAMRKLDDKCLNISIPINLLYFMEHASVVLFSYVVHLPMDPRRKLSMKAKS